MPQWAIGPIVALIVIFVGWLIAVISSTIVAGGINKTGFGEKAKKSGNDIGKSLASAVFWTILLIFILIGLSQLSFIANQLNFFNSMMKDIFSYIPKLVIGIVVFCIGIILAKVVKNVILSTLQVAQVDKFAAKHISGDQGKNTSSMSLSNSLATLASAIILILFGIAAIGIWNIPGISKPVSEMLELVLDYIPRVLGAVIIIVVAVFIGNFVSNLAQSTLPALGLDRSFSAIEGLDQSTPSKSFQASKFIGIVAFIAIVLMGLTAAMTSLNITSLSEVFHTLLVIGGKIILGAVIIGAGVFVANLVAQFISTIVGTVLANIIRYVIIILISFMGLSEMGLGEGIVVSAFNWSVGAAAVAAAIAFGLGGREWAKGKLYQIFPVKKGD